MPHLPSMGFQNHTPASFALIAYASAYLKCHYLAAFTAALLNNQPMGFYSAATIVKDAQRHGLKVKPVDVLHSGVAVHAGAGQILLRKCSPPRMREGCRTNGPAGGGG